MRGCQIDLWRAAFVVGLQEARCTQAPTVTWVQSREPIFRARRTEVIADIFRKGEEFSRHHSTDCVAALIGRTSVAMSVTEESGNGVHTAFRQGAAQYVYAFFWCHLVTLGSLLRSGGTRRRCFQLHRVHGIGGLPKWSQPPPLRPGLYLSLIHI